MQAYFDKEKKTHTLRFKGTVLELLRKLKINQETVIVVRNNEVLNVSDLIDDKDDIRILSVVSGG